MRIYAVADIHGKPEKIAQRGNGGFWPGWITAGGNAIEYGLTTGGQWFVQRLFSWHAGTNVVGFNIVQIEK
jgi:hypothetical protein